MPAVTIALLVGMVAFAAGLLGWINVRYPPRRERVIDLVDALLPQTQCAQCGYPGCRPYARAIVEGARLNLCPPGGEETQRAIEGLLNRAVEEPPVSFTKQLAVIDEARCIGCYLCVEACPVDAIVGAPQFMHTVLSEHCTGCELCLPPCPVDCIALVTTEAAPSTAAKQRDSGRRDADAPEQPCIRCGRCEPVCPVDLHPEALHWYANTGRSTGNSAGILTDATERGLERCIECGLCNQVCPSNIDLAGEFRQGKEAIEATTRARGAADLAKARFEQHERRRRAKTEERQRRRAARLESRSSRHWDP